MKFTWTTFKKVVSAHQLVGPTTEVNLPQLGIEGVVAKVDTGAHSGALHATNIREVEDGKRKVLLFEPLGSPNHTLELDTYHKRSVRSSNGQVSKRYAIDTEIEIQGQLYPITITLTDRSTMKYELLIGRSFLRTHGFLVDVSGDNK